MIRLARRLLPVTPTLVGERLVVRLDGRRHLTPLALALIMIESTDAVFALDSIPAIFAITSDPFLVFTSNVMAMLGLRSLYFALAGIIRRFYHLKLSLAVLLVLIGTKMLFKDVLDTEPSTTSWALAATTARRTPEANTVAIPARRRLHARPT